MIWLVEDRPQRIDVPSHALENRAVRYCATRVFPVPLGYIVEGDQAWEEILVKAVLLR